MRLLATTALTLVPVILSQSPDAVAGTAGWVGAGLLGAVLAWLMFVHLPAKDKMITGMIEGRDALVRALAERHDATVRDLVAQVAAADKERRDDFRANLTAILTNCQRENEHVGALLEKGLAETSSVIVDLRRTIEDLRAFLLGGDRKAPPPGH
jgi:hypothetical protein